MGTSRQVREERGDVGGAEIGRVLLVVKHDEATDPVRVGFFGTRTEVPHAARVAHLVEEPRRPRIWALRQAGSGWPGLSHASDGASLVPGDFSKEATCRGAAASGFCHLRRADCWQFLRSPGRPLRSRPIDGGSDWPISDLGCCRSTV
jgi:hypothetical protein